MSNLFKVRLLLLVIAVMMMMIVMVKSSSPPSLPLLQKFSDQTYDNLNSTDEIPSPFDTTLTRNLTSTCIHFFQLFLTSSDFNNCTSFGFLLQNSDRFAEESRNFSAIGITMDKICKVNDIEGCGKTYLQYANNMTSDSNCGVDLKNNNLIANEALVAFRAYQVMQIVGCSKNSTNIYCYQDALLNGLGLELFYLPLGTSFSPKDFACSECNKKMLNTYADFSSDKSLPLSKTLGPARTYFNNKCGSNFVKDSAGNNRIGNNLFSNNNIYLWLLYLTTFNFLLNYNSIII